MSSFLRHLPKFTYSGLAIIMSNPSRFDKKNLLDGTGGYLFNQNCLGPDLNRFQCDIRLVDDKSPLLPGTKCILLLGQRAQSIYTNTTTTIDENRGSPFIVDGMVCISSFSPQDAVDPINYERKFNAAALAGMTEEEFESDETAQGDLFASKGRGKTSRANYMFWLKNDTKKAIKIVNNNGQLPKLYAAPPNYHIAPSADVVISKLKLHRNVDFFFDMETDFTSLDMRCFAFSFGDDPYNTFVVPTLDIKYKPYYGERDTALILAAFIEAVRDNCIVAHNGAAFDFFVLAHKYKIPVRKCYDTMLAQHRIFPKAEKSLGHCVSLLTYEPYHKNEGCHTYLTQDQANQLYLYCGKDVFTMYLVKKAQDELAAADPGLAASIDQANKAIRPYLLATMAGIKFNETKRQAWIRENDRLMVQYLRIMRILMGPDVEPLISNKKCVKYFHDLLGYKIVSRTKTGNASLAEDALLKLALKERNPVIDVLIKYRQTQKETGTLQFKPWKQ